MSRSAKVPVDLKKYEAANSAQIRLTKDLEEVKQMRNVKLIFPDEKNIQHFLIKLKVSENLWRNKWFTFDFIIDDDWPNVKPEVLIVEKIWHPNIQLRYTEKEKEKALQSR